ncbi:hypothetical protein PR048_013424 [Dryococelus australis]|uniref:Reverse transcriptase domain-containing protein n=1 Tax=Dryococelus australis TaxID=614101 RepID=A0ABQ9HS45_9NEOP|nr:hypothetical protein PR048_013424 [Dryococelus australis]
MNYYNLKVGRCGPYNVTNRHNSIITSILRGDRRATRLHIRILSVSLEICGPRKTHDWNLELEPSQHGFLKGKSTESAIAEFTSHIHHTLEKNRQAVSLFLNLSKVFDTVDHEILLNNLEAVGIRGVVRHWFKSYLSNRTQKSTTPILKKITGVHQGSVLRPVLFLIYINDLTPNKTDCNIVSYPDDINISKLHYGKCKRMFRHLKLAERSVIAFRTENRQLSAISFYNREFHLPMKTTPVHPLQQPQDEADSIRDRDLIAYYMVKRSTGLWNMPCQYNVLMPSDETRDER